MIYQCPNPTVPIKPAEIPARPHPVSAQTGKLSRVCRDTPHGKVDGTGIGSLASLRLASFPRAKHHNQVIIHKYMAQQLVRWRD
jgi:hypothetical protein